MRGVEHTQSQGEWVKIPLLSHNVDKEVETASRPFRSSERVTIEYIYDIWLNYYFAKLIINKAG